jgi:hypothetical protein
MQAEESDGDVAIIVHKLHHLAIDPRNRQLIADDKLCLETIIGSLDCTRHPDDVIFKSMEIISYLISHSVKTKIVLSNNSSLISKLQEVSAIK